MSRPVSQRGESTREVILAAGIDFAREVGLDSLTIGALADRVKMSKSGLFAHFGSKEELQLSVLRAAQKGFNEAVLQPALKAPRGLTRLRRIFEGWLDWCGDSEARGGCVILAASYEFDDRPGPVRDMLADAGRLWLAGLARSAQLAIETGELPANVDTEQFAFQIYGLVLSTHFHMRLLSDPMAPQRALQGLEQLIAAPPRLSAQSTASTQP